MKKIFSLILLLFFVTSISKRNLNAVDKDINLDSFFGDYKGTAIFFDNKDYYIHNKDDVHAQTSPCSTFKIVITLAGLEYGVLKNENDVIKWDREKRFFES